jgi:hypothetical protein
LSARRRRLAHMHCCGNGGFASMMKAYKQPRHEPPARRAARPR